MVSLVNSFYQKRQHKFTQCHRIAQGESGYSEKSTPFAHPCRPLRAILAEQCVILAWIYRPLNKFFLVSIDIIRFLKLARSSL